MPLPTGTHHNMSTRCPLSFAEYNRLKKSLKLPTSQSWAALLKLMFHWTWSPDRNMRSATEASFSHATRKTKENESFRALFPHHKPQGVGLSGEGLGLGVSFPSRSKVQHLMGANNPLGPHPLVKSQRFNQFRVGKLPRVRCTGPEFILQGWVQRALPWRGSPTSKKKNSNDRIPKFHYFTYRLKL